MAARLRSLNRLILRAQSRADEALFRFARRRLSEAAPKSVVIVSALIGGGGATGEWRYFRRIEKSFADVV